MFFFFPRKSVFLLEIVLCNIASNAAQSNSVYVSALKITIVHADSVSKSLRQKSRRI